MFIMKFFLRKVIIVAGLLSILSNGGKASENQRIVLSTSFGMPYVSEDGKEGFLNLLAEDIFRRVGVDVNIVILPAERSMQNVNQGIEDGELNRISGLEKIYPNLIMVSEPLISVEYTGFTKVGKNPFQNNTITEPIQSWSRLEPYIIGIIKGWKIYEKEVAAVKKRTIVRNMELLFKLLENDRADIIMVTRITGHYYSHKFGIATTIIEPPFDIRGNYIYLHKQHAHLVPKLTAALRAAKADGTYDRLYKRIIEPHLH